MMLELFRFTLFVILLGFLGTLFYELWFEDKSAPKQKSIPSIKIEKPKFNDPRIKNV